MKTVCLAIGHSSKAQGAFNEKSGLTEWQYNYGLAAKMMAHFAMETHRVDCRLIHRGSEETSSYEVGEVIETINGHNPDLIISLHGNAFDHKQQGHAALHHPASARAFPMSERLMYCMEKALSNPNVRIRQRGDLALLSQTRGTAIILEPFFIDNNADCENAVKRENRLAFWLYSGIMDSLREY